MILGETYNWIKGPFPHQQIRFDLVSGKADYDNFDFNVYLQSQNFWFDQIAGIRKISFEADYRRRSQNFDIKIDNSPNVLAYASPDESDIGFISRGLILAINDACQSIASDSRSGFALNSSDGIYQDRGIAPNVVWIPAASPIIDPFRYANYDVISKLVELKKYPAMGLLHKFVSASPFRQQLADLISAFSMIWVMSHEDAHHHLGHMDYFDNRLGASPDPEMSYFQEYLTGRLRPEKRKLLTAAEVVADRDACIALADQVCFNELFEFNDFLFQHLEYCEPDSLNDKIAQKRAKTIYLFRLCVVSATIAIAIFERNTIKNSAGYGYYPSMTTRIMNCVIAISGRIQSIAQHHPARNLYLLSDNDWLGAFLKSSKDIDIILKYIFEIGFVLQDREIDIKKVHDVLDYKLDAESFCALLDVLILIRDLPDKIVDLPESAKEKIIQEVSNPQQKKENTDSNILDCISNLSILNTLASHTFLNSKLKVNQHRLHKVEETHKNEILMSEKYRLVCSLLKQQ